MLVMPSTKHTAELAAEPRPWQRIPLPPGELHDGVHGQEIGRVLHRPDQLQLVTELAHHDGVRHAFGVDALRPPPRSASPDACWALRPGISDSSG